jgi:arylsulfatase
MARGILESPWLYFALAGALLLVAVATQFEVRMPTRSEAPASALADLKERDDLNVIYLLIDTLRADRLSVYGYERETSPIIDDIAKHGILFENTVSQSSWTKTSMASMWTGTHPIRNGILRFNHVLPDEATLPAEIFKEAGYRTVGLWRNGWVEPNFGFAQGFDMYVRPTPGAEQARVQRGAPGGNPLTGTDEDMTISAIDFLRQAGDEKFFLYLHYMDIHQYVYDDISSIFGTSYSDAYDQSIHWTDRLVGALLETLREEDLLKRTLIVIASDHGEAFREHQSEGHARNLHEEVTHVPFIVIPPFILEEGIRVKQTVSNLDVWPTILDLVGLPELPGADGRSLMPLVLDSAAGAPATEETVRPVFAHLAKGWGQPSAEERSMVSLTHGDKRVIRYLEDGSETRFYDRSTDRAEHNDLAEQGVPEEFETLLAEYAEWRGDVPWGVAPTEVELDELRLNHLRALGYIIKP